jgi:hypothetical protein
MVIDVIGNILLIDYCIASIEQYCNYIQDEYKLVL